jgi:hypothetical protein
VGDEFEGRRAPSLPHPAAVARPGTALTLAAVPPTVTWPQVLALRLQRQHLAARAPSSRVLQVTSDIAGLHAQLASSAELTLLARTTGLHPDYVTEALWKHKTLVKTWSIRGTLHHLPSAELPLWTAAQSQLKPRHHVKAWLKYWGLTREQADAMVAAIPEALAGEPLTREGLARAVADITRIDGLDDKLRGGFGDLLKPAAFRGDLCFAPSAGRNVRFTRPDRWLGPQEPVDPEQATSTVTRRYLAAYGPATREAFARWFGMTSPAQAGRWLQALGEEATTVELDGEPLWMLAADVGSDAEPEPVVRLLPAFDQYVIDAPRDRAAVLEPSARDRVYRKQGWISPVLLVGGRMAGVWSHERQGGRIEIEIEPFGRLAKADREAAGAEADALGAFLGGTAATRWAA